VDNVEVREQVVQTIKDAYGSAYDAAQILKRDDGIEIYYEVRGDGPPLCVINNMYIVGPLWKSFTTRIVEHTRLITYDLRNQGASTQIEGEFTLADHVGDLLALLDALEIEQTYLLGTSTSTLICRDFALAHPERVRGMVLLGPFFNSLGHKRRKYLTRSWLNTLQVGGPRALFEHFYPLVFTNHTIERGGSAAYLALRERFQSFNSKQQLERNLEVSLTTEDDPKRLTEIACPTLVGAGDGDFLNSPKAVDRLVCLFPNARATIIPHAGHVPYFEATDHFENLVLEFIDGVQNALAESAPSGL
jgi:3-oxoadipate enol-lactonase